MNFQQLQIKKFLLICNLPVVMLLVGCVAAGTNVRPTGPLLGVVELDQNTDPRFFLRPGQGTIGLLKTAGNEVWLDGERAVRDVPIQNGARVSTGANSGALIEFFSSVTGDCGIEVLDFQHGRLFGLAERCGQFIATTQGAMETRGRPASYNIESQTGGSTVFTAIKGQFSVWLHSSPSQVVVVPSYHQVIFSFNQISAPRRLAPGEIEELTRWRQNFQRYRREYQTPARESNPYVDIFLKEASKIFQKPESQDRVNPPTRDNPPTTDAPTRVDPQLAPASPELKRVPTTTMTPMPVVTYVTVPNLEMKTLAETKRILNRLGLNLRHEPSNARDDYWVYEQNPAYNSKVVKGTVVNVRLQQPIR